jgi:hypothetical protein
MAWSVIIWKICGFHKVSLYLERFMLKHATAHIHKRWQTLNHDYEKNVIIIYWIIIFNFLYK